MISSAEALSRVVLSTEDSRALSKFEASIDTFLRSRFDGTPIRLDFNEVIPPKIAAAIQRSYEAGGWKASFAMGAAKCSLSLTPTATTSAVSPATITQPVALPPVAQLAPSISVAVGKRLLVRMPTRGRPAQALSVLELYRSMAGCPIQIEVVIDEDDETMLAVEVQQRLVALGCVITVGKHKSKIEAVNAGRLTEWDVLLLASDDMWPVAQNYAARVLEAMEKHFPHLDGVIYFSDGYQGRDICTLPMIGRRLHAQFDNNVYEPAYASLFSDTEQTLILRAMGKLCYIDEKIIEHRHHLWGKADKDALYERNDALGGRDEEIFKARARTSRPHAQWPFDSPPLLLSILICTIPSRKAQLEHLLDAIWAQIYRLPRDVEGADPRMVEILVDGNTEIKIGVKRQHLLDRARGHFVASIDDDDSVSYRYMATIVDTLCKNPTVDALAIRGVMTTAGVVPEIFEHSMKHKWETKDSIHLRPTNHINPVRRELALQVGFNPDRHYNEDQDFGERLQPLLKTEVSTGDEPLYFYFYTPKTM